MEKFYDWLTNINSLDFHEKSALIIGSSEMSRQYALALKKFGIDDITIIAKSGKYISKFCEGENIYLKTGGYEKNISQIEEKDLTIIALPIPDIINAMKMAIENGQKNILIEKPGSLYYKELESASELYPEIQIRVAYNRLVYPNFYKLKELVEKDAGITSCRFTFTELLSRIDFEKDVFEVYQRWGISNSLHVISMAFELIGMPKEMSCFQKDTLEWHKSGSTFVGAGISNKDIPFSYNADWGSGGRWGLEVNTRKNSYQLIPLEEIYKCPKDTFEWKKVDFEKAFSDIKQGIAEEVAIMLQNQVEIKENLPNLKKTVEFNKIAEKIFGYT